MSASAKMPWRHQADLLLQNATYHTNCHSNNAIRLHLAIASFPLMHILWHHAFSPHLRLLWWKALTSPHCLMCLKPSSFQLWCVPHVYCYAPQPNHFKYLKVYQKSIKHPSPPLLRGTTCLWHVCSQNTQHSVTVKEMFLNTLIIPKSKYHLHPACLSFHTSLCWWRSGCHCATMVLLLVLITGDVISSNSI